MNIRKSISSSQVIHTTLSSNPLMMKSVSDYMLDSLLDIGLYQNNTNLLFMNNNWIIIYEYTYDHIHGMTKSWILYDMILSWKVCNQLSSIRLIPKFIHDAMH